MRINECMKYNIVWKEANNNTERIKKRTMNVNEENHFEWN